MQNFMFLVMQEFMFLAMILQWHLPYQEWERVYRDALVITEMTEFLLLEPRHFVADAL